MQRFIPRTGLAWCLSLLLALLTPITQAAPLVFDFTAEVLSSDRPGAPAGSLMTGQWSYDPEDVFRQVGSGDFEFNGGASLTVIGSEGFFLQRDLRIVSVSSIPSGDYLTLQSFISESPNDWHMVIDFIEPGGPSGWLQGDESLPETYPETLNSPYLVIYFTDEYEWVRYLDARILSVSPVSAVPVPAAGLLLPFALMLLRRRR